MGENVKPYEETWRADLRDVWVDKSPAWDPTDFIAGDNDEKIFNGWPTRSTECEARARLAAAAPELYRALEALATWATSRRMHDITKPELVAALAALKKARGGE